MYRIEVILDKIGGLTIRLLDESENERIREYLAQYGQPWDGEVYVWGSQGVADAYEDLGLQAGDLAQIGDGWTVEISVDPWVFLHYVGWNAAIDL